MDTRKILGVELLSKVCKMCRERENDADTPENAAWRAEHEPKCQANYQGSVPNLEPEGAMRIFSHSVEKHKLVYSEYYGDGDRKSYSLIKEQYAIYSVQVQNKECVGHVQKRLGTSSHKLKKEKKGMGGKGRLTDSMINRLQNYYGIAIRSNSGNLPAMRSAIHASLFHCASSADRKLHLQHCSEGPTSWCGYMRDRANQTTYHKHGAGLPLDVIVELKLIFARLSEDNLLSKCLDGKTQNQNEALNAMFWERVPKSVFVGPETSQLGIYDAVALFGCQASVKILEELGISPGNYCTDDA